MPGLHNGDDRNAFSPRMTKRLLRLLGYNGTGLGGCVLQKLGQQQFVTGNPLDRHNLVKQMRRKISLTRSDKNVK